MQFQLLQPFEYIKSVEGTYANPISATVITSLVFKTSLRRTSPTFGNQRFVLANNGQKLVGFHGRRQLLVVLTPSGRILYRNLYPTQLQSKFGFHLRSLRLNVLVFFKVHSSYSYGKCTYNLDVLFFKLLPNFKYTYDKKSFLF